MKERRREVEDRRDSRLVGSFLYEEGLLLHISFRSADPCVNVAQDGFLLLPHVSFAVLPVKVSNDGSSDDQAAQ